MVLVTDRKVNDPNIGKSNTTDYYEIIEIFCIILTACFKGDFAANSFFDLHTSFSTIFQEF